MADARDPHILEGRKQGPEAFRREPPVVMRVGMNREEHDRGEDADAALAQHSVKLAASGQRVRAMLERVEAQRRPDFVRCEAQGPQVLDPVDTRAGAHVGAEEAPAREQPTQVVGLAGLDLERSKLDDRLRQLDRARELCDEVHDHLLGQATELSRAPQGGDFCGEHLIGCGCQMAIHERNGNPAGLRRLARAGIDRLLARRGLELVPIDAAAGADPFRTADFPPAWTETVQRVSPYTLTSPERIGGLIAAVEHVVANRIAGAFVECGVWRGGSAIAAALTFQRLAELRDLYLFDTFAGTPTPPSDQDVDLHGVHAGDWWSAELLSRAAVELGATRADVETRMRGTGYPHARLHLVPGLVQDTIPVSAPDPIAVLRLDTDFYDSTRHELEQLWPRLSPGGILIVDDYGHFQGARRAVEEYFRTHRANVFLHRLDYTARLVVK